MYDFKLGVVLDTYMHIDNLNKELDVILHNNNVISSEYLDRVNIFFPINVDRN